MPRYIEREKFLKKCAEAWGYAGVTIKAIKGIADECTTADVVEVVRCRDCKHYGKEPYSCRCELHSEEPDQYGGGFNMDMLENDFCSYGERKEKVGE